MVSIDAAHVTWSRKTLFWNELSNLDDVLGTGATSPGSRVINARANSQMHVKKFSEWKKLLEGWLAWPCKN